MEYDLSTTLGNTANFAFLSGSSYYMTVTISGIFWGWPTSCAISGGLSNSYGEKPVCSWISSNVLLISNFDRIDMDAYLGAYRLKIMFYSTWYWTGSLYSVSGAISMWSGIDAYNNGQDPIFSLTSTNSLNRAMSTYWSGTMSSWNTADNGAFKVNSITSTSTTLSMSLSYNPTSWLYFTPDYSYWYWTFQIYNFNIPAWSSISVSFTYDSGVTCAIPSSCMQYLSTNQFRLNTWLCGRYYSTCSADYVWKSTGTLQITMSTALGIYIS